MRYSGLPRPQPRKAFQALPSRFPNEMPGSGLVETTNNIGISREAIRANNLSGYQREKVPGAGADGQGAKVAFWFWFWFWPCAACGWF